MKPTLTPQDWAQLSEYLDGQLGAEAARKLEARLALSAELRQGLDDLRRTRAMLRALRPHPVPHNFTLTRAMAAEARRVSRWFPVLSFSSVIATLSAVVLMGLRLLPLSAPNLMAAPAAAPAPMMESMDAASAPTEAGAEMAAEPTPMIITWGFQESPGAFGMGGGGSDMMGRGGGMEMEDAAAAVPAPAALDEPAAPAGEMAAAEPAPTEMPAEPPAAKEAPAATLALPAEAPLQTGDLILGLPAPEEQGQMLVPESSGAQTYAAPSENRESQKITEPAAQPWVLPLGLLALGVGLGLAAWQVRRR